MNGFILLDGLFAVAVVAPLVFLLFAEETSRLEMWSFDSGVRRSWLQWFGLRRLRGRLV